MENPKNSGEEISSPEWKYKGDGWYENLDLKPEQLDRFIRIASIVLGVVVVLIILEAAGIFKL